MAHDSRVLKGAAIHAGHGENPLRSLATPEGHNMHAASTPTTNSDHTAVVAVVRDYFEGWFDGDTERMQRVLHPRLAKRSLRQVDRESPELRTVTTEQMLAWTAEGEGRRSDPGGDRRIDVEVVDLYGNIASVVVRSPVYREYLHLVRADEGWRIANALWHWT